MNKKYRIYIKKCRICNKKFETIWANKIYCSQNCSDIGKKNNYKKNRKRKMLINRGKKCVCKMKKNIHEHHIIPRNEHGKETVSLCKKHHIFIHKFISMLKSKGYKIIKI